MNYINRVIMKNSKRFKRRSIITILGIAIATALIYSVFSLGLIYWNYTYDLRVKTSGDWNIELKNTNADYAQGLEENYSDVDSFYVVNRGWTDYSSEDILNSFDNKYMNMMAFSEEAMKKLPVNLTQGRLPQSENEIILPDTVHMNSNYNVGDNVALNVGSIQTELINKNYEHFLKQEVQDHSQFGISQGQNYNYVLNMSQRKNQRGYYDDENYYYHFMGIENINSKQYTVTGFYEPDDFLYKYFDAYYLAISALDESAVSGEDSVNAYIKFDNPYSINSEESLQIMQDSNAIVSKNDEVLASFGLSDADKSFAIQIILELIMTLIILHCAFLLIFNTFSISSTERNVQYGVLSSIGATGRQIFNSIISESLFFALIGIPLGFLMGKGIITLGINFIRGTNSVKSAENIISGFLNPAYIILVPLIIVLIIVFMSAYIPALRASKTKPISAVKFLPTHKLAIKQLKTNVLVEKIFKFEGVLALKDLNRNQKKYHRTVISLAISIILLIGSSATSIFLTEYSNKSFGNIDASLVCRVSVTDKDDILSNSVFNDMSEELDLDKFANCGRIDCKSFVSDTSFSADGKKYYQQGNDTSILVVNDEVFRRLVESFGVDSDEYFGEGLKAVALDHLKYYDDEKDKYVSYDLFNDSPNKYVNIHSYNLDHDTMSVRIAIGAHSDKVSQINDIFSSNGGDRNFSEYSGDNLLLLIPEEQYNYATENGIYFDKNQISSQFMFYSDNTEADKEKIKDYMLENNIEYSLRDIAAERAQNDSIIYIIKAFSYCFVFIILVVTIANVFNTILTGLPTRKREFAMFTSVGMDKKSFMKLIWYESFFYGIKAMIYGIPLSFIETVLIYLLFSTQTNIVFAFPFYSLIFGILIILAIGFITFIYTRHITKNINLLEYLRMD